MGVHFIFVFAHQTLPLTLVVSDIKATALEKLYPLLSNDDLRGVKVNCCANVDNWHIQTPSTAISHTGVARIMHDLSVLSLDSSISMENGPLTD